MADPQTGPIVAINGQFQVNATAGDFRYPSIAEDGTGDTMVVFSGQGSTPGIISERSDQTTDTAGPVVADVLNVAPPLTTVPTPTSTSTSTPSSYQLVREGTILNDSPAPTAFVVDFNEDVIHDSASDPDSVTNPANWTLTNDGNNVSDYLVSIQYGQSEAYALGLDAQPSGKYEAVVTFNSVPANTTVLTPLPDGQYILTVMLPSRICPGTSWTAT